MYSFSKLSTIEDCKYAALLTYIQHRDGESSVYGILGNNIHDKLEQIMNNEADKSELSQILREELSQLEMLGLEFPKDFKGNDTIRDNWVKDMEHFVNHFEPPEGKFNTEEFLLYKVDDDHYIQGYADLVRYDTEDGSEQSILDWKTSSMYDKAGFLEHGRQLVIYALAKEQAGIKINDIAWIFLKYVNVTFFGKKRSNAKKKTEMTKSINRRKIAVELDKYIRDDLTDAGYDDVDIETYMLQVKASNSLESLPDEIKAGYKFEPCIIKYDFTDEIKEEAKAYINRVISEFESLDANDESDWPPREFYKINKMGNRQEDTFFCNFLCDYRHACKHLDVYNKMRVVDDVEDFL